MTPLEGWVKVMMTSHYGDMVGTGGEQSLDACSYQDLHTDTKDGYILRLNLL